MDNEFVRRIQREQMKAVAHYLQSINRELVEIKKLLQKKGVKTEEVKAEEVKGK